MWVSRMDFSVSRESHLEKMENRLVTKKSKKKDQIPVHKNMIL
jgi:hypothetical protein